MRGKKTYSIAITLLLSLSCHQPISNQELDLAMIHVNQAVEAWEAASSIQVDNGVTKMIASEFSTRDPNTFSGEDVVLATELYLYEIRDIKRQMQWTRNIHHISTADSCAISPSATIDLMALKKPRGYLKVSSEPDGAEIIIDGISKGQTNRKYVLSPGKHTISIKSTALDCTDEVTILDDQTETYHCSPDN